MNIVFLFLASVFLGYWVGYWGREWAEPSPANKWFLSHVYPIAIVVFFFLAFILKPLFI